jgi:hypothetical protein
MKGSSIAETTMFFVFEHPLPIHQVKNGEAVAADASHAAEPKHLTSWQSTRVGPATMQKL